MTVYIATEAVNAEVTITSNTVGDIDDNGTVTITDALILVKAIVNNTPIGNGDVNGDGKVGIIDAIRVLKLAAN